MLQTIGPVSYGLVRQVNPESKTAAGSFLLLVRLSTLEYTSIMEQ